ncbi:glycosyltransferase [Aliarcobacter cryaerophilus]|uniref:glycosyltransferase n=1 Tax=Aliarcobacter cryaerophilus TaxID=28198 RepID=UPI003DA39A25
MKNNTAIICLSKTNGGMELASVKLARILSEDVNIEFIARAESYIVHREEHFKKYKINLNIVNFHTNFSLKLIFEIRKILINKKIKNIIFFGASEMKSLYFATLGLDINFIIRQGTQKNSSKKDIFHKLLYSNIKYFIGNSEYIKKNILNILPTTNKSIVKKIYSSVNIKKNIIFKKYDNTIDLISIGRICIGKGQLESIKACEILFENNINFKIKFLGDIQEKDYYIKIKKYIENLPYKKNIEFIGYTPYIESYLEKSDIFILPTLGEGMSNAIIEALGFGLIPIIYNNTSIPEFKDLGFYINLVENNTEKLKEELLKICLNIESEKINAIKNHEKAIEIFSSNKEKEEYLSLLK